MLTPGQTTLGNIRATVRQRADMVNTQFVTDAELNGYISASYFELYDIIIQKFGDDYESITGVPPPIAGGSGVSPALDLQARREIAARLGHGRVQITNVYCGKRLMPTELPHADHGPIDN